jgi:hypothetical protein
VHHARTTGGNRVINALPTSCRPGDVAEGTRELGKEIIANSLPHRRWVRKRRRTPAEESIPEGSVEVEWKRAKLALGAPVKCRGRGSSEPEGLNLEGVGIPADPARQSMRRLPERDGAGCAQTKKKRCRGRIKIIIIRRALERRWQRLGAIEVCSCTTCRERGVREDSTTRKHQVCRIHSQIRSLR